MYLIILSIVAIKCFLLFVISIYLKIKIIQYINGTTVLDSIILIFKLDTKKLINLKE